MGTLYLVSTPIGNLGDVSARTAEVLGSVDRLLAEDTRRARILLDHLGIDARPVSLHDHNEAMRTSTVLDWLSEGRSVALVSDAGTPLISDPGERVVAAVAEAGHRIVPVPGASATLAALVASGLPTSRFTFLGFPARRGVERAALVDRVATSEETCVLFEAPGRVVSLLGELAVACGEGRRVSVARELTKKYEDIFRGTLAEAASYYEDEGPRGEVTLVVAPAPTVEAGDAVDEQAAMALARALKDGGARPSEAAREISRRLGLPRNVAYRIVHTPEREKV